MCESDESCEICESSPYHLVTGNAQLAAKQQVLQRQANPESPQYFLPNSPKPIVYAVFFWKPKTNHPTNGP